LCPGRFDGIFGDARILIVRFHNLSSPIGWRSIEADGLPEAIEIGVIVIAGNKAYFDEFWRKSKPFKK